MVELTQGGLRKRPLQERSKAATQRILDTAMRLVVEVGYDAVAASPTLLLKESGVSRGSFYSFFETPEKVLDELAYRCMQDAAERLKCSLATPVAHWHEVVDAMIAFYRDSFDRPLVRELWVGQHLTPPVRAQDRQWIDATAAEMLAAFQRFAPMFAELSLRQCVVATEILERLFQYAYTSSPDGNSAVIDEARTVLCQYLAAFTGDRLERR